MLYSGHPLLWNTEKGEAMMHVKGAINMQFEVLYFPAVNKNFLLNFQLSFQYRKVQNNKPVAV